MKRENLHVYFIKPVGMDGPIKIGCSAHTGKRLLMLSNWSPFPLEILVEIEGGFDLEGNIHQCFADLHLHREWFRAHPRLTSAIAAIASGAPVADAIDLNDKRGKLDRKPTGAAQWADHTRRYMGLLHKTRFAVLRAARVTGEPMVRPEWLDSILDRIRAGKPMTAEDEAAVERFMADPGHHSVTRAEWMHRRFPKLSAAEPERVAS